MQVVSSGFMDMVNGDIQPLSWGASVSFKKEYNADTTFWTWDESVWDGEDLWAPVEDNPIQAWDKFNYTDFTYYTEYISISRKIEFPYSVASSIADFQFKNEDGYFNPNSSSPLAPYVRVSRPVRLFLGMGDVNLQKFVGLTDEMPDIDDKEGTATFTAMDFLTWIYETPIRETKAMENARTDEILEEIFTQFGLSPSQYDLARGRNVVPFVFFDNDQQKAGDIIRPLMQAEMGSLWLDDLGIIKFRPRLEQPTVPVETLTADEIEDISVSDSSQMINKIIIKASPRVLQDFQIVYSKAESDSRLNVIPAGGSAVFIAELSDPGKDIQVPTAGENSSVSWFTAALPNGTPVTTGITVTAVKEKTNSYQITFANSNTYDVNINQLYLWGRPAKEITAEPFTFNYHDDVSVRDFGEQLLEINNNFIQTETQADSLALTVIDEYKDYADVISANVKPNPARQLSDIIEIDYPDYEGEYRIIGMDETIQSSTLNQQLLLRKYTPRTWWTWDQSVWDGTDVWAP